MVDGFATFFRFLVLAIGILAVLASYRYLDREKAETGEYHALLLFSIMGQCVMVAANDLIMIFIGLEISSIATYILAGYLRNDKRNNEAALKYFLLGSFATGFLLYGIAHRSTASPAPRSSPPSAPALTLRPRLRSLMVAEWPRR